MWKKLKSGLQYRGLPTHRAQCPHTQFERGDYSLWINDVREEDGGVYSCAVDGEGSTVVTLRIMKGMKTVNLVDSEKSLMIIIILQSYNKGPGVF